MTQYDLSQMEQALPREAAELLQSMGISGAEFSGLFDTSFSDAVQAVLGVFRGELRAPVTFLSAGFGILALLSICGALGTDGKSARLRAFIGSLFLVSVSASPLFDVVNTAVDALRTCGAFLCALIPVLAAVVAAAGSPVFSVCWQTAAFTAAQTVSAAASGCMAPACGMLFGMGVLDCLMPDPGFGDLAQRVKKIAVWIFSAMATLFTAFLSLKGILASSADTLSAKGIKLAVSSFIPVIGSQLSEAYGSVVGALAAVRATAGVYAIAGVCALMLPAAARCLLWIAALRVLGAVSALLAQKDAQRFFGAFSASLSMLHACLLFVTALFVICVGIILTVKAAV